MEEISQMNNDIKQKNESEWDKVMQAYHKGNAMRLEEVKAQKERYGQIYATDNGIKMTCTEIQKIFKEGGFIIDVRNPVDFISGGKIHNSVNVPLYGLLNWCNGNERIDKSTPILLYSNHGNTSETGATILKDNSYANVTNIGTHKWYGACS